MSNAAAREILIHGARALAHVDDPGASLEILLGSIAEHFEIGSAAIVIVTEAPGRLDIAVTVGLGDAAIAGLAAAVASPGHPIARTVAVPVASFDVLPTAPGGPALRSHLPLIVTWGGEDIVLGVLALAHDHRIDPETRPLIAACADLAAIAIVGRRLSHETIEAHRRPAAG